MALSFNDCELCKRRSYSRVSNGIKLCESCFSQTIRLRDGNDKEIRYFSNPANLMYASDSAKKYVRSFIPDWFDPHSAVHPDPNVTNYEKKDVDLVISETDTSDKSGIIISNSTGSSAGSLEKGSFEYEIVTVPVKSGASISNTEVSATLTKYAGMGWKLHTILQNELSSAPSPQMNINISGSSEIVMIFERMK